MGTRIRLNIVVTSGGGGAIFASSRRRVIGGAPGRSAAGDRPRRIGRPLAPRSRVEQRASQAGVLHRQQVVAGGDARAAGVDHLGRRRGRRAAAANSARSCAGGLERAVSSRLARWKRLSAPGMWPATASIGSTSPRKRSPERASSTAWRGGARGDAGSVDGRRRATAAPGRAGLPGGAAARRSSRHRPLPGGETAVEHGDRAWPSQRSIHQSLAA